MIRGILICLRCLGCLLFKTLSDNFYRLVSYAVDADRPRLLTRCPIKDSFGLET